MNRDKSYLWHPSQGKSRLFPYDVTHRHTSCTDLDNTTRTHACKRTGCPSPLNPTEASLSSTSFRRSSGLLSFAPWRLRFAWPKYCFSRPRKRLRGGTGAGEEERGGGEGRNELEAPISDVQVSLPHALSLETRPPSLRPFIPTFLLPSQASSFPPSFTRPLISSDANVHVELRGVLIQFPHQMEGPLNVVRQRLQPLQEVLCKSEEGK